MNRKRRDSESHSLKVKGGTSRGTWTKEMKPERGYSGKVKEKKSKEEMRDENEQKRK